MHRRYGADRARRAHAARIGITSFNPRSCLAARAPGGAALQRCDACIHRLWPCDAAPPPPPTIHIRVQLCARMHRTFCPPSTFARRPLEADTPTSSNDDHDALLPLGGLHPAVVPAGER
jgi:hypothetical protein